MLLYLDTCCLNRPFDDQSQPRVFLESEAVLAILAQVASCAHQRASSAVLLFEIQRIADQTRRDGVMHFLGYAEHYLPLTPEVEARAVILHQAGFKKLDALHVDSAETMKADAFLSTDDRLVSRAHALGTQIQVSVLNPSHFNHPSP